MKPLHYRADALGRAQDAKLRDGTRTEQARRQARERRQARTLKHTHPQPQQER
jgi:hypothetical protein